MKEDGKDVGHIQDWMFAVQHLISAEHHLIESYAITNQKIFLEANEKIRKKRSKLMFEVVPKKEGQIYCITKHLLGASQGLKELANRLVEEGNLELSKEYFKDSQEFEAIVMILNDFDVKKKSFINIVKDKLKVVENV